MSAYPVLKNKRLFLLSGIFCIVLAALLNEWVVAAFLSDDGQLHESIRAAIWLLDIFLLIAGSILVVYRHRLPLVIFNEKRNALQAIFICGILLRILVYVFLQPENNDPHLEVVRFIVEHGQLPTSEQLTDAFHPPLYYLLAAPLALVGPAKLVQLLSLALSLLNFWLLFLLIKETELIQTYKARCHALILTALLPQFVIFGNFISNDSLSFLIGTLVFVLAFRYLERPSRANLVWLAVVQGMGLLTKGSFLAWLPLLSALIFVSGLRARISFTKHFVALALFLLVALSIGSYKYIENTLHFGRPIVDNSDLKQTWVKRQQGTYRGLSSIADINIVKLVRHPFLSEHTLHSVPLLLYATFWYGYIPYESNFAATREFPLSVVPRSIYLLGVLPIALMLFGAANWLKREHAFHILSTVEMRAFNKRIAQSFLVLLLVLNLALVVAWGVRHDAWSFFQARLVFPSFLSIAILFGSGVEIAGQWRPYISRTLDVSLFLLYIFLTGYFSVEIFTEMLLAT